MTACMMCYRMTPGARRCSHSYRDHSTTSSRHFTSRAHQR